MKVDNNRATDAHIEQHMKAIVFLKNNPEFVGLIGNDMTEKEQTQENSKDISV